MPVEFEEYKPSKKIRNTGVSPLAHMVEEKNSFSILRLMVSWKIAKNEDYAKLILLIVALIIFAVAMFFIIQSYQNLHPDINTAPIDLNQITPSGN